MRLVIISGRSGSGKSTALNMLEDLGYYCVDNLPAGLMPDFATQAALEQNTWQSGDGESPNSPDKHIAIGIDARNLASNLEQFSSLVKQIPADIKVNIVFLDANDATLIKRFSETRRKHPLSNHKVSLSEALAIESQRLENIASMADLNVDTSELNLHQLRQVIRDRVVSKSEVGLSLMFQSFGFKGKIPIDSDFVFDVRCLPNPYWQIELREFTGKDEPIQNYLGQHNEVAQMLGDIKQFVTNWLPHFESGNRSYLTVSIGCTGGRHRSVYLAERLRDHFSKTLKDVQVRHRELGSDNQNKSDKTLAEAASIT